jgi:GDP-D-mannose dehydratase
MNKTALITGISGQDGSYLAELLLSKGYKVVGIVRRHSIAENQTGRIDHLMDKISLEYGDMSDMSSLVKVIKDYQPDEIYHLAAQSHVRISFDQPIFTSEVTGIGTLNLLEAIRLIKPDAKLYNAGSSEMFGNNIDADGYQRETTPMTPVSPYGCAKVFSYNICHNYRNAYDMFISTGMLFNHECVSENSVVILKNKTYDYITIDSIKNFRKYKNKGKIIQQWKIDDYLIWDGDNFVNLNFITATKRKKYDEDFKCKIINTRNGIIETTNHHSLLTENEEKIKCKNINVSDYLLHKKFPENEIYASVTEDESLFLGLMVGDGHISEDGSGRLTNNDDVIIKLVTTLWKNIALGNVRIREYNSEQSYGKQTQINFKGGNNYLKYIRKEIYSKDKYKKIPDRILNSSLEIKQKFLEGYNLADGLKSKITKTIYKFKNFKTNSHILAQGLLFLLNSTTKQKYNITFEKHDKYYGYYSINLLSNTKYSHTNSINKYKIVKSLLEENISQKEIYRKTNISRVFIRKVQNGYIPTGIHHKAKPSNEIKKIYEHEIQPEWVYDIETDSGKFMTGVGNIVVANSPRRGINFVTNKVAKGAVEIHKGLKKTLTLGNLEASRDWSHSKDMVVAMWMMLQLDTPDDFVCASGKSNTIKTLCEIVFSKLGMNYEDYVTQDEKFLRAEELHNLRGDCSKLVKATGWTREYTFEKMMNEMVDYWMEKYN